jgi:hypothetical protein
VREGGGGAHVVVRDDGATTRDDRGNTGNRALGPQCACSFVALGQSRRGSPRWWMTCWRVGGGVVRRSALLLPHRALR